jgi:hypothetical protein
MFRVRLPLRKQPEDWQKCDPLTKGLFNCSKHFVCVELAGRLSNPAFRQQIADLLKLVPKN